MWVDRLRFLKKKKTNFSSLRSCYHKLANRKNLFRLEKYFKTLNDMIIGTACTKLLESLTIFQSGRNNGVKIWVSDATKGISRYRKLPLQVTLSGPWYWFYSWSNSSVLCSSCKNTFVGDGNLQVITNKLWCENLWGPYVLYPDAVLCIYSFSFLRNWSI